MDDKGHCCSILKHRPSCKVGPGGFDEGRGVFSGSGFGFMGNLFAMRIQGQFSMQRKPKKIYSLINTGNGAL